MIGQTEWTLLRVSVNTVNTVSVSNSVERLAGGLMSDRLVKKVGVLLVSSISIIYVCVF